MKKLYLTLTILTVCLSPVYGQYDFDKVESYQMSILFTEIQKQTTEKLAEDGPGDLDPDLIPKVHELSDKIMSQVDSLLNNSEILRSAFLRNIQTYFDVIPDIYKVSDENSSPEYNELYSKYISKFDKIAREQLMSETKDYFRKFEIKYGETSEKLNFAEIFFTNILFPTNTFGDRIYEPNPKELIFRIQTFGYQYYYSDESLSLASPTFQLGLTRYLYADKPYVKALNHIGLAAAYQYDLNSKHKLIGGILHVSNLDVGMLFDVDDSFKAIVVSSFNIQLFKQQKIPDPFK